MNVKKNKIVIGAIIIGLILVFGVVGIGVYCHFRPYIQLKHDIDNLLNKEYEYNVDCKVEGMDLRLLGDSFQGSIEGTKGKDVLYGEINYNESTYLKMYVDKKQNIIFDASPLIDGALDKISENSILGNALFGSINSDIKVSYAQVEYILNREIDSIENEGVSTDLMKNISNGKSIDYTLSLLSEVEKNDKLLDDDAYYFEIKLKKNDTKLVVGIPKDSKSNKISMRVYAEDITWSFVGDYSYKAVEDINMPESTVSDKTIDVIKSIYDKYLELVGK